MKKTYIFRILNIFSIVFMIINFLFNLLEYKSNNILLYIWICSVTSVVSLIKDKNQKNKVCIYLCFVGVIPGLFSHGIFNKIYIIIITLISFYIVFKSLFNIDYEGAKYQYSKAIFVIIGSFIFAFFVQGVGVFVKTSIIYIIIFFLTSVMLLRTLRNIEYTGKSQSKTSIFTVGSVFILSLVLCIDGIRKGIFGVISKIYSSIIDFILNILAFIFKPLVGSVDKLINGIKNSIYVKQILLNVNKGGIERVDKVTRYRESLLLSAKKTLMIILCVIIGIIALYILYRIFTKISGKKCKKKEYIEEREFILKDDGKNILRKIANAFKMKNNNEKIRYYYKKLLKLYINKGILIQDSDTTIDINIKAKEKFDYISLKKIRDIYIGIRYGATKADNNMLYEFEKNYKGVKR